MNSVARTVRHLAARTAAAFRLRSVLGWVLTTLAVATLAGAGAVTAAAVTRHSTTVTAPVAVGALFPAGSSEHSCSASVLDTPDGDLILTAAHCVTGTGVGMTFAPGYSNGNTPYGSWTVTAAYAPEGWLSSGASTSDLAVLRVAPKTIDGKSRSIESVVGGYAVGSSASTGTTITVAGYAAGSGDSALVCETTATTTRSGGVEYPTFSCGTYPGGTSGSPWLTTSGGKTSVVGVIGGLRQGGCTDTTSYSSPLEELNPLIATALTSSGQTLPSPPSNGC